MIFLPKRRMPVPASIIILLCPHVISKQVVFPPYLMVSGPGQGMLPRVPQNLRRMEEVLDIKDMCNCWDNYTILQDSLSLN